MTRTRGIGLLAVALIAVACTTKSTVDRLTIVNDTRYDLEITVTDGERSGWRLLGRTSRGQARTKEQIEDLGDVWIFRFEYPGPVLAGELRVRRETLERNGWRIEVPRIVEPQLRVKGIEPSAGEE